MERENTLNRKRTREDEAKKQERPNNSDDDKWYEFYDGIGVFDFPWLKESVVFKTTDDYFDDHDQEFSPCSYLDETFTPNLDPSSEDQKLCFDINAELHEKELDDDNLQQVDCIWSFVIDQPLDIGFHKGCVDKL